MQGKGKSSIRGAKLQGKKLFFIFILLFIAVLCAFVLTFKPERISQEVLDLFPQNESKTLIEAHRYFASSKYVPLAIKGFDENALTELKEIEKYLLALPNVASIVAYDVGAKAQLYDFLTHNEKYLLSFKQDSKAVSTDANNIFAPLLHHFANPSSNSYNQHTLQDTAKNIESSQDIPKHLEAKDYGLMLFVELESLEDSALQGTLEAFKNLAKTYPTLVYFSPDFMRVENLHLILQEVNFLLSFASLVFIVLYFVIIRIPFLTFCTILTLIFSNTIAILLTLCVYPKVTIMALSFGMGISNIAIDYMMHHHFFGAYTHSSSFANASLPRPRFNKAVFYGYLTTMVGFGVCLFVPFPLLAQLALYAMISLSVAYVSFAFIYPRVGFKEPRIFASVAKIHKGIVPSFVFLVISLAGFIFVFNALKLDFDLSKLDYQNTTMLEQKAFFESLADKNQKQVLLFAQEKEGLMLFVRGLLQHIGEIKFHINEGNSQLSQYYYLASFSHTQLEAMRSLLDDITHGESPAYLWNTQELESITKAHIAFDSRSLQEIMDGLADDIYKPMLIVLLSAFCIMLVSLAFNTGRAFLHAWAFVLFPLSMALCVVASHSGFNMMHLFALLILVVVSVDYGIYAIKEGENPRSTHAILFSALTTGISFGILITSQTKALNSFGEVIFTGMCCMLILLITARLSQKGKE